MYYVIKVPQSSILIVIIMPLIFLVFSSRTREAQSFSINSANLDIFKKLFFFNLFNFSWDKQDAHQKEERVEDFP